MALISRPGISQGSRQDLQPPHLEHQHSKHVHHENAKRFLKGHSFRRITAGLKSRGRRHCYKQTNRDLDMEFWFTGECRSLENFIHGGRALDAVEAGAKIPEGDPKETSVGLGGLPDRDGHVTLDACIMDENGIVVRLLFLSISFTRSPLPGR